jgi:hypothetical protein
MKTMFKDPEWLKSMMETYLNMREDVHVDNDDE